MRFIKGFFGFWYDFIVGDDWRVAAGVILSLAVAALLVKTGSINDGIVAVAFFMGVLSTLVLSLRAEATQHRPRPDRG